MVTSIPFGTATQMRTVVIKRGRKKLYFFDIPRTRGKQDFMEDVYSVIEQVKNGNVQSSMYGDPDMRLLMHPPMVWVFSNALPDLSSLSQDRWRLWQVDDKGAIYPMDPNVQEE